MLSVNNISIVSMSHSNTKKLSNTKRVITETRVIVAQKLAGYHGIILEMRCKWSFESKWNLSSALSVAWMSACPDEQKVLLFGNFNQFIISNIYLIDNMSNNDENKLMIESINNFEQLCDGYPVGEVLLENILQLVHLLNINRNGLVFLILDMVMNWRWRV